MEKVDWCFIKGDMKLVKPNENVCNSYIKKAENSLMTMRLTFKNGIIDWALPAAYYARYHVVYALFMKCGIKSEIHDCTIALFDVLFPEIQKEFIREFYEAKEQRIDAQYYTDRMPGRQKLEINIETAADFVLKIKDLIRAVNEKKIEDTRNRFISLKKGA